MSPVDTQVSALDDLIARERRSFLDRAPKATEMGERAGRSLAGGVTSSWQISDPQPIWIDRGLGSRVWDVDGNEYVDLHGGYGAMLAGHAHPAVVAAVSERVRKGTHFAQPTADAIVVAEELTRRYGMTMWRFGNSGTESTMDAVHLMRAITGRDLIIKFEGGYHGHHDSVMVSVWNEDGLGSATQPKSVAAGGGIPSGDRRTHPGGAVQRSRRREPAVRGERGQDRRGHRRADPAELRDPAPSARIPPGSA